MNRTLPLMKWITFALEALMAIPLIGGSFVISYGYSPLFIAFILHLVTLVLAIRARRSPFGNGLGVLTSALAWIPLIGWMLHSITAVLLLVEVIAVTGTTRYDRRDNRPY